MHRNIYSVIALRRNTIISTRFVYTFFYYYLFRHNTMCENQNRNYSKTKIETNIGYNKYVMKNGYRLF